MWLVPRLRRRFVFCRGVTWTAQRFYSYIHLEKSTLADQIRHIESFRHRKQSSGDFLDCVLLGGAAVEASAGIKFTIATLMSTGDPFPPFSHTDEHDSGDAGDNDADVLLACWYFECDCGAARGTIYVYFLSVYTYIHVYIYIYTHIHIHIHIYIYIYI